LATPFNISDTGTNQIPSKHADFETHQYKVAKKTLRPSPEQNWEKIMAGISAYGERRCWKGCIIFSRSQEEKANVLAQNLKINRGGARTKRKQQGVLNDVKM